MKHVISSERDKFRVEELSGKNNYNNTRKLSIGNI